MVSVLIELDSNSLLYVLKVYLCFFLNVVYRRLCVRFLYFDNSSHANKISLRHIVIGLDQIMPFIFICVPTIANVRL